MKNPLELVAPTKLKVRSRKAVPIKTTKDAINRLKLLVQQRIAKLEQQGTSRSKLPDQGLNTANLLARTLEKVLELEEQQRKQQRLIVSQNKGRDDAWREELAGRLARLGRPPSGPSIDQGGGQGAASRLATLGA